MEAAAGEDLPTRFGRYEVITKVASGGTAEVYVGRITGESGGAKVVAIKAMRPELVDEESCVSMFLDEARVAAHVSSPHVVSILDLGCDDRGLPYLVMELVVGASLAELGRARPGPWPAGLAVELIAQAASGLHDAHEARDSLGTLLGIVHHDVSPQNVLVGMDGRARVADFGVARAVMRITKARGGEAKVRCLSPEQAAGATEDRRSDVFALGIVGWELFTGLQLFQGRSVLDVRAVLTQAVDSPDRHRPELPGAISTVLHRALARKPDDRYRSAGLFARELRKAAASSDVDLANTSQIARFVEERAATNVNRLTRSIRDSAAPSKPHPAEARDVDGAPSPRGWSALLSWLGRR